MLLYFHFGDTPNSKLFWLWQSTGYICIWAPLWSIYKVVIKEIGPYVQPMCHWRSKTLHLWCTAHQILAFNVMQLHIAHSSVSILQSKDSLSQYSKPWLYSSPIRMLFDELSMRHHGDEVKYLRYPNLVIYRAFLTWVQQCFHSVGIYGPLMGASHHLRKDEAKDRNHGGGASAATPEHGRMVQYGVV